MARKTALEVKIARINYLKSVVAREFNPKETLQWVGINRIILFSWGFRKPTAYENKALSFEVSGRYHKGIVLITLNWDDTYTLHLLTHGWDLKEKIEGVYCDVLNETIDFRVEKR